MMKRLSLVLIFVFINSVAVADWTYSRTYRSEIVQSRSTIFGGQRYYSRYGIVESRPSIFGNYNHYSDRVETNFYNGQSYRFKYVK